MKKQGLKVLGLVSKAAKPVTKVVKKVPKKMWIGIGIGIIIGAGFKYAVQGIKFVAGKIKDFFGNLKMKIDYRFRKKSWFERTFG